MAIARYVGEVFSRNWSATAKGGDREGLVLKVESTTATTPRVCLNTATGDAPYGILFADMYDQSGTIASGGSADVSVVTDGVVPVAVTAGTYHVGEHLVVGADGPGHAQAEPSGGQALVGICEEYKVVATGDQTAKTDQVLCRLALGQYYSGLL